MNQNRFHYIDLFRGLAIFGMVLANYLAGVEWISPWFKHARDAGFTVIDLVAPMFIFAIGLTYKRSFDQRFSRDGARKTYQHFVTRFFAILGMGALLSAGEVLMAVDGQTINWGVLQAIGVAGIVTLLFIRLPGWLRALIGLLIIGFYQFMLNHFWLGIVLTNPHGGLLGSISWSAMLIFATVLSDIFFAYTHGEKRLIGASALVVLFALVLTIWTPISKNRVSLPYVFLSTGLSGLIFAACVILVEKFHFHSRLLSVWGENPLLMYLLHMILLGIVYIPGIPAIYAQAPVWLVILEALLLLGILSAVAFSLDRKKVFLSI